VTAIDWNNKLFRNANRGDYIEFSAPGVEMWTAFPGGGGRVQSGTSFAAPFLTALMAVEVARSNGLNLRSLRKRIKHNGIKDIGPIGRDKYYGWGVLNQKPVC